MLNRLFSRVYDRENEWCLIELLYEFTRNSPTIPKIALSVALEKSLPKEGKTPDWVYRVIVLPTHILDLS